MSTEGFNCLPLRRETDGIHSNEQVSPTVTTQRSPNTKEGQLAKSIGNSLGFYLVKNPNAQAPAWKFFAFMEPTDKDLNMKMCMLQCLLCRTVRLKMDKCIFEANFQLLFIIFWEESIKWKRLPWKKSLHQSFPQKMYLLRPKTSRNTNRFNPLENLRDQKGPGQCIQMHILSKSDTLFSNNITSLRD